jgi:hypothetical protein
MVLGKAVLPDSLPWVTGSIGMLVRRKVIGRPSALILVRHPATEDCLSAVMCPRSGRLAKDTMRRIQPRPVDQRPACASAGGNFRPSDALSGDEAW